MNNWTAPVYLKTYLLARSRDHAGFPPTIFDEGIYYGVRVRGRLVSAAGTHAINIREGIVRTLEYLQAHPELLEARV